MKKNKVIFLATEIILCVLALFFTFKMFDQNETEKKVAVIVQNSGDKNWNSFIKGLKESAKVNNIHLIICNADEINNIDDQKELINEQIENGVDAFIISPAPGSKTKTEMKTICGDKPFILVTEDVYMGENKKSEYPVIKPDNYKIGYSLGKEMVGKSIKKIGIVLGQEEKEETADRYKGFEDAIKDSGMKVAWKYNGIENKDIVKIVNRRSKVDAIVALDNYSLDNLGENAREDSYNGAKIYGVGTNVESFVLVDYGKVECVIIPDGYEMGYKSVKEITERLNHTFYVMKSTNVEHKIVYKKIYLLLILKGFCIHMNKRKKIVVGLILGIILVCNICGCQSNKEEKKSILRVGIVTYTQMILL